MVDILESGLSDVSGTGGPRTIATAPRAPIIQQGNAFTAAADIANMLVKGGLAIEEKSQQRGVDTGVENAVSSAFTEATGINENLEIDEALSRLDKLRKAGAQGKDVTDRFNIALLKETKKLKSKFPHRTALINKSLANRGLIDPQVQLLREQATIEDRQAAAQGAREEKLINDAVAIGGGIFNETGNPASGVNREETLKFMNRQLQNEERKQAIFRSLGVSTTAGGKQEFTLRPEYIRGQGQLRSITLDRALVGIRPAVNQISEMLNKATPNDIPKVRAAIEGISAQVDQFRLQQRQDVTANLNPKEAEDHMAFVDTILSDLTRGIVGLKDSKDLSQMKAAVQTYDFVSKNAELMVAQEMPTVFALSKIDRNFASSVLNMVKFTPQVLKGLTTGVGLDLGRINDWIPKRPSTDADISLGKSEEDHGTETKAKRASLAVQLQQDWITKGTVAMEAQGAHVWVQSQSPLFNAHVTGALSTADVATLSHQQSSPNWNANFQQALKTHPENAKRLGAYSYDVTERTLTNLGRQIGEARFGLGRLGVHYDVKFDPSAQTLSIVNLEPTPQGVRTTEGAARGRIRIGQQAAPQEGERFVAQPGLATRVAQINRLIPHLVRMRQFKAGAGVMSEQDFTTGLVRTITGQQAKISSSTADDQATQTRTGGTSGIPPTIQGTDDPIYRNLKPGDTFIAPDGSLRRKRAEAVQPG